MSRIGLLAGSGKLPIVFSKTARAKGDTVIAFALKGVTEDRLKEEVDKVHWLGWGDYAKALLLLATERIGKVIMLGKMEKSALIKKEDRLDTASKKPLGLLQDKKDYTILNEVTKVLTSMGIEVLDVRAYIEDLIPAKGLLTRSAPTEGERSDIEYGREAALQLSMFDIGQTVAVKDRAVIAVEAVDGTDATIERAGRLIGGGFVVVKTARPDQDMRLDVPLAGPGTLRALIEAKGRVLAMEGGKTILMDKDEVIKLADENNISVVII